MYIAKKEKTKKKGIPCSFAHGTHFVDKDIEDFPSTEKVHKY